MSQTIQLTIQGMTCDHCVNAVTRALKGVPGVTNATVRLESQSATIEGQDIDLAKAIAAVEEEGYEASAV